MRKIILEGTVSKDHNLGWTIRQAAERYRVEPSQEERSQVEQSLAAQFLEVRYRVERCREVPYQAAHYREEPSQVGPCRARSFPEKMGRGSASRSGNTSQFSMYLSTCRDALTSQGCHWSISSSVQEG